MNALTATAPQHSQPTVLRPQTMTELLAFAQVAAKSSLMPRDYVGKPENIVIAVQMGSELGLAPMQAIQNIAVINGKPSVYGDAMLGLVLQSPLCEDVQERTEGDGDNLTAVCVAKRAGKKPVERTFSVDDAKKANLWGKSGPWQQYPQRMLQMRARGFALRDAFADVLRGLISAEEASDYPTIEAVAEPVPTKTETKPTAREQINRDVPLAKPHPMMPSGPVDPNPVPLTDSWAQAKMAAIDKHKHLTPSWTGAVCKAFIDATSSEEVESLADEVRQRLQRGTTPEANHHIGAAVQAARKRVAAQPKPPIPAEDVLPFPGDELPHTGEEEEAPHIVGEENVLAG